MDEFDPGAGARREELREINRRLAALDKNSHPPKPCLDPESFDEWAAGIEERISKLETWVRNG